MKISYWFATGLVVMVVVMWLIHWKIWRILLWVIMVTIRIPRPMMGGSIMGSKGAWPPGSMTPMDRRMAPRTYIRHPGTY